MTDWPQHIEYQSDRGRIVSMDSMGYVDHRNDVSDVLVCGSHSANCAVQLVTWLHPRGLIGHDAGIGKRNGGVSGLKLLEQINVPGAAVSGKTARIGDGRSLFNDGIITVCNSVAQEIGIKEGMKVKEAAKIMLNSNPPKAVIEKKKTTLFENDKGKIIGIDTIKYGDKTISDTVICMGSHASISMANYVLDLDVNLRGIVTNDAGMPLDDSGITGLPILDKYNMPVATVSSKSAEMGNAVSTYEEGIISSFNKTAKKMGIYNGMKANEAAILMLTTTNN